MRLKGQVGRGIYRVEKLVRDVGTILKRGEHSCTIHNFCQEFGPYPKIKEKSQRAIALIPT